MSAASRKAPKVTLGGFLAIYQYLTLLAARPVNLLGFSNFCHTDSIAIPYGFHTGIIAVNLHESLVRKFTWLK